MSRVAAREVLMKLLYERDIAGEYHSESFKTSVKSFNWMRMMKNMLRKSCFPWMLNKGK